LNSDKSMPELKQIDPQNTGRVCNKARRLRRYTPHELIVQCDRSAPMPEGLREWLDAPVVGKELIG
jgi:hypothetical protein